MSEDFDIFCDFLKTHNLRMTAVRKAIIEYIENTAAEFSLADLRSAIRVQGTVLHAASLYRNIILLKKTGLIENAPEKKQGKTFFRLKKHLGRSYEIHCPGCHRHQQITDETLDAAILAICARYDLKEESILVRIDARHKRH